MATWKELGEVPDSEDDEDLESLSGDSPEEHSVNELRIDEDIRPDDQLSLAVSEQLPTQGGIIQDGALETTIKEGEARGVLLSTFETEPTSPLGISDGNKEDNKLEKGFEGGEEEVVAVLELPQAFLPTLKAGFVSSPQPEAPSSPLVSLQNLDLPSSWSNLLDENGSGNEEELRHVSLDVPTHEESPRPEEISKCYVEITSASPSKPSASLASLSSLLVNRPSAGESITNPKKRKVPVVNEEDVATGFRKRNFRERTGKQLHPYQHEQMAYDRSLRERGIKPIKIVETEERRLASLSPDSQLLDSQNLDSQDGFIVMEESQETDHVVERQSPVKRKTPLQSQNLDETMNHTASIDSDDDLPPVEDLIQKPKTITPFTKRPSKTYSTKGKRPPPQLVRSTAQISSPQSQRPSSIFDVQTSPPVISSPFPNYDRGQISRTTSASSGLPTPRRRPGDHRAKLAQSLNTAAVKPLFAPILVDSDDESDLDEVPAKRASPDLIDLDEQSDAQSSSDESVELRRVGKKIRGVLPASHLRLDSKNKKQATPLQTRHASRSVSPMEAPLRRGVALPTIRRSTQGAPTPSNADMAFLDGISDDDEDETPDMITQTQKTGLGSLFAQSRVGDAEEEDTIDLMLPSQKRRRITLNGPKKKRKIGHSGHGKQEGLTKQPRITEHLDNPRTSTSLARKRATYKRRKIVKEKTPPPRLGILDVTDTLVDKALPLFIRVAARTSRAKVSQGRQSPTKKFIRLANREDTADARSVLQEWRNGTIRPKNLVAVRRGPNPDLVSKIGGIDDRGQSILRSPTKRVRPQESRPARRPGISRKLEISNRAQQSMNGFVLPQEAHPNMHNPLPQQAEAMQHPNQSEKRRTDIPRSRPAQLESLELTRSDMPPVPKFRYGKGTLDLWYRLTRKQALLQANVPLSRFMADENLPRENEAPPLDPSGVDLPLQSIEPLRIINQRKKRLPRRLDVGAAEYRQPNASLVLDFLAPVTIHKEGISTKLHNLGKYGTHYPTNFDIFPLPPGVFFQDTTFIGSGRLAGCLKDIGREWRRPAFHEPPSILSLGVKEFYWGNWNDQVSSEVGICFDWIVEQHNSLNSDSLGQATAKPVDVLRSMCGYVQSISFVDASSLHEFVSRMKGVLDDFLGRMNKEAALENRDQAAYVELMKSCVLLCLRILLLSRSEPELSSLTFGLEALLQRFAGACVKVLLALGLEKTRKLYDNLQYISIRDRGIGSDDFETEVWVVILKVLNRACIPRGSFMDVVNSVLLDPEVQNTQDARIMEKMWYTLFSLLPLSEFDDYGFLIQGSRHATAFDNWGLPQQMLKGVFELYKSDQRQSPSFNDYCRSIVSRCHCLMVEWGWWKCSGVVGTLFDFFASQNLAHLRNEEAHESPRFLQELHLNPSFEIEPEDRCFHIFLKIVALGVKHFSEVNNEKGGRSLVARLLPNHDRQYPKEEEILERDLASLRNHHDLLCTLYFATPSQQRFSPALIQSLVDSSHAHKQAVIISLRAWERLTLFVLSDEPSYENFLPLAQWHRTIFQDLLTQYANTEIEIRSQAAASSNTYTEGNIMDTVRKNQKATEGAVDLVVSRFRYVMAKNKGRITLAMAQEIAHLDTLAQYLKSEIPPGPGSIAVLEILQLYTHIVVGSVEGADEDDSQNIMILFHDQYQAAAELGTKILDPLAEHIRNVIQSIITGTSSLAEEQVETYMESWADLVRVFMKFEIKGFQLRDLIGRGKYAVLNHLQTMSDTESHLWIVFLCRLLESCHWEQLTTEHIDIGTELLKLCMRPPADYQETDSTQLAFVLQKEWYLLKSQILPARVTFEEFMRRHESPCKIIERVFKSMNTVVLKDGSPTLGCKMDGKEAKKSFNDQICNALTSVEHLLKDMAKVGQDKQAHRSYVEHVQLIVSLIRVRARSVVTSIPIFFSVASNNYWPPVNDPTSFKDMTKAHLLNLNSDRSQQNTVKIVHFLLSTFDKAIKTNMLSEHNEHLQDLMANTYTFFTFIADELAIPLYDISMQSEAGWVLLGTYYPQLATALAEWLRKDERSKDIWLWTQANELITKIIRFTQTLIQQNSRRFADSSTGVLSPKWDRILAILVIFWQKLGPVMKNYADNGGQGAYERVVRYEMFFESLQLLAPEHNNCDGSVITFPDQMMSVRLGQFNGALMDILKGYAIGWSAPPGSSYIKVINKTALDKNTSAKAAILTPHLWEAMHGKKRGYMGRAVSGAHGVIMNVVGAVAGIIPKPETGGAENARNNDGYEGSDGPST